MSGNNIQFIAKIKLLPHLINTHYIEVNSTLIKKMGGTLNQRLICTINGKLSFQCGLMALGKGSAYITINSQRLKKLNLSLGDEVNITLKKDKSQFGMEMPNELQELLQQDQEGHERFNKLSPGKQRYIINYVGSVKNTQKRIDRALLLINNLKKLPHGKEQFRAMLSLE